MRLLVLFTIFLFVSVAGGFFILEWGKIKESESEPKIEAMIIPKKQPASVDEKNQIAEAKERSGQVHGVYAGTAYNQGYFKNLLKETGLNGIVIDVKEYYGVSIPPSLKEFIQELHRNNIWVIARVVVFKDTSLLAEKPEWYLKATSSSPWQDRAGQYWLDPQNEEVQNYLVEFSKKVIDLGFDELQFDYIRYPDDYSQPVEKCQVIGDFFSTISHSLKNYQPSIILSVDLFGYIATLFNSHLIGQRLVDAGEFFDYLSFMLYPSHFYGGFYTDEIQYSYPEAVSHPYEVVYYSVLTAKNYLANFSSQAQIRPWLQAFDLTIDKDRGVLYDVEKIKAQIEAAQNATSSGWLFWNPSSIYTVEALK